MPAETPVPPSRSDIDAALWADVAAKRLGALADYVAQFGAAREPEVRAAYDAVTKALWEGVAVVQSPAADLPSVACRPAVVEEFGVGVRVGPWVLGREIGRGGQGIVYLAEDPSLRRRAAVKILTATDFTGDALDRFRREAAIAFRLDHPGICAVYDVGLEGRTPYIAMRYVEGETLAHRLAVARARTSAERIPEGDPRSCVELPGAESSTVDPPTSAMGRRAEAKNAAPRTSAPTPSTEVEVCRIARLFEQIARALHAAHEAGVIHRDLKPGNVIVTASGEPVILDFGLAKDTSSSEESITRHGDLLGTPAYMSPEQLVAHRITLDCRTDIFSLGVTLYECLTLRRPFDAPTREGVYQAILTCNPLDPRTLNRSISGDLRAVLARALRKDRKRRYATAADFAEDLRRVAAREPISARSAGPIDRFRRWSRRNRVLVGGLLASLVAMGVVAFYFSAKPDDQVSPPNDRVSPTDGASPPARETSGDRRCRAVWRRGECSLNGGALVVDGRRAECAVHFDGDLVDFDLTYSFLLDEPSGADPSFRTLLHVADPRSMTRIVVDSDRNPQVFAQAWPAQRERPMIKGTQRDFRVKMGQTYEVLAVVRGSRVRYFIDGDQWLDFDSPGHVRGAVGFNAGGVRATVTDLRINDPAGQLLFEGVQLSD